MGHLQYLIACGFVLILYIQQGTSISCFMCNSHEDSNCMNDFPPDKYKVDCPGSNYILCRKIKQVIDFDVNGLKAETRVIRSCGYYNKSHTNQCYQRSGFGGRQEVCACQTDYCNTNTTLIVPIFLIIALLATLKIFHWMLLLLVLNTIYLDFETPFKMRNGAYSSALLY